MGFSRGQSLESKIAEISKLTRMLFLYSPVFGQHDKIGVLDNVVSFSESTQFVPS